jgi:hypothetical protein
MQTAYLQVSWIANRLSVPTALQADRCGRSAKTEPKRLEQFREFLRRLGGMTRTFELALRYVAQLLTQHAG